jgi:hypothetical protein
LKKFKEKEKKKGALRANGDAQSPLEGVYKVYKGFVRE